MTLTWPSDIGSGKVTWWLGSMSADNWDADRDPQISPYAGVVVDFIPDVTRPVRYTGSAGPRTIMPEPYQGIINDDGYLCTMNEDGTAGEPGVILPATDAPTLEPRDWTYSVQVTNNRIRVPRFSITVPSNSTTDLTQVVPVDQSGGTSIMTVDNSVGQRIHIGDTMIYGDTGIRDITPPEATNGRVTIRRLGNYVHYVFDNVAFGTSGTISQPQTPIGFRSGLRRIRAVWLVGDTGNVGGNIQFSDIGWGSINGYEAGQRLYCSMIYETLQPWPTTLPGTPR